MRRGVWIVIGIALLALVMLVACDDDTPACAAPSPTATPTPVDALRMLPQATVPRVTQPRPTFKPPDQPRQSTRVTINPARPKDTPKATSWKNYSAPHDWGKPYGKGRPVPPQPTTTIYHGREVRVYPGYSGYYAPGYYPVGYGATYGCSADYEGDIDDD